MKITEKTPIELPISKLEKFCRRKFTLEVNGFELLALQHLSSSAVGGIGAFRSVFSECGRGTVGFSELIDNISGAKEVLPEFAEQINVLDTNRFSDNLWDLADKAKHG